jgi:hypothetical protein
MLATRLALAFTILVAACGFLEPDDPREDLSDARALWAAQAITRHEFRFARSCECLPEETRLYRIRVTDGAVVEVRDAATGNPAPSSYAAPTVEELFALVQDAVDRGAARIEAQYDSVLGYPTRISVDYDLQVADEELMLRAEALASLP